MAQKVNIILTDDLDPSVEADESVTFGLDGATYEIDLTSNNADTFRGLLTEYIAVARKVSGARGRAKTATPSSAGSGDAKAVRAWAKENGIDVPERGRIPADVRTQYDAAN